jgi:hypothetical protein
MAQIGFSTGSLAFGDFQKALRLLRRYPIDAVELSALRFKELKPLMESLDGLDLSQFKYVSVHAPSAFTRVQEKQITSWLASLRERGWPIVLHADAIIDYDLWKPFGSQIAIENMDKRKTGRTVEELSLTLEELPEASICLDLGHARQVDRTMTDAFFLLKEYGPRIVQFHISEVNTMSHHDPLSWGAVSSFQKIAPWIPPRVPIILESVVAEDEIEMQMEMTRQAVRPVRTPALK